MGKTVLCASPRRQKVMFISIINLNSKKYHSTDHHSRILSLCIISRLEVTELRKRFVLRGIHLGLIQMGPKLVAYVTFLVYVLAGNKMTSETVFFTMTSLFVVVQIVLHFMPEAFAGIGETIVAINRIQVGKR